MKRWINIALLALVALVWGCTNDTIYSHYQAFPTTGWEADSALCYGFSVSDTIAQYDIVMNLRHNDQYPNQNIWVFAELYSDSVCLSSDTLDYFLADQRGRWLGNGFGSRKDMPMLYMQHVIFPKKGEYYILLRHGMREQTLRGVTDMGVTISQSKE